MNLNILISNSIEAQQTFSGLRLKFFISFSTLQKINNQLVLIDKDSYEYLEKYLTFK